MLSEIIAWAEKGSEEEMGAITKLVYLQVYLLPELAHSISLEDLLEDLREIRCIRSPHAEFVRGCLQSVMSKHISG